MSDPLSNPLDAQARILIVDDSPTTVRVLAHFLSKLGQIHFATSGAAALASVANSKPDIILLDVEMPEMDGYEVCRHLQANPEFRDIPVIFVTAHNDAENELKGLEAGAVDFISKPINEPIVLARVRTHLTLKRQSDILRELAAHDGLTGAFNRRSFDACLEQEFRRHRRTPAMLTVMMIDIDHFKLYNDRYGHQQGDDCLRAVAQALTASVKRPGDLVARYGGEEFGIVLPNTDLDGALIYGNTLCENIRSLAIAHAASLAAPIVTISVGVASGHPNEDQSPKSYLAAADHALYRAKAHGRNRVESGDLL